MSLKEQINADFVEAYKARNMEKKNFLGVLKGAIQNQEGKLIESTDENVLKLVKSFEKAVNETLEAKTKLGDVVEQQKAELIYLMPYLPTLMSVDEIRLIIKELLTRENLNKNIGFLMGVFNLEQKGKGFDNKSVLQIIKEEMA